MRAPLMIFLAVTSLSGGVAAAQELDPRTYSPTPVGTTVVFGGGGRSEGAFILDPSLGIEDVVADLSFWNVGAAYVFGLAGRQAACWRSSPTPGGMSPPTSGEPRSARSCAGWPTHA